jgi:hypothetical protein
MAAHRSAGRKEKLMLTQEESDALMNDLKFRGRVKVCCLKYSTYIMDEANTVPAHNTRMKWAATVVQSPDAVAQQMTPSVVMDSNVQTAGADITDPALQSAVETTVNKLL